MPEPRLTREQDAQLRRLLAEARHDDPLPADVAHRLDRVLAGLRAEGTTPAAVADLDVRRGEAARTRRRTVARLLVAAAAVLVVGVGIGHVVSRSGGSVGSSDSSAVADRGGGSSVSSGSADQGRGTAPAPLESAPAGRALSADELRARLPVPLSSARLGRDVRRASGLAARAGLQPGVGVVARPVPGWTCAGSYTPVGDADLVLPARYDGEPALLVLSPTAAGHQRARVLACGTFAPVRRLVVRGS